MSPKNTKKSILSIALIVTLTISFGFCCTDLEWTCMSGECIEWDEICDGIEHCKDRSDETVQLCFPRQCPTFAFRCAYGACVIGTAKCNGESECADNSDEISCQTLTENTEYDDEVELDAVIERINSPDNGNCLYGQFECMSGNCISNGDVCDGIPNCADLSDENVNTCAAHECQAFAFRCNYGACINSDKVCNDERDCVDGSDEDSRLCANDTEVNSSSNPWSTPTSKIMPPPDSTLTLSNKTHTLPNPNHTPPNIIDSSSKPIESSSSTIDSSASTIHSSSSTIHSSSNTTNTSPNANNSSAGASSGCVAPTIPNSRLVYVNDDTRVIPSGQIVPHGTKINYECKHGYTHIGTTFNTCLNSEWNVKLNPKCIKYCPAYVLTDGVTFEANCKKDGIAVSCRDRIAPGTIATIKCATRYRKPKWNPTDHLQCGNDGEWDYQPYRCEPICGDEMFGISDRANRNATYVPWHVGIYKNSLGSYNHICSGTIISAKVIISAAYCFWDNQRDTLIDTSMLVVGAGKYYLDYYTHELNAEFQNISAIHIKPEFKTEINHSNSDIAVLILVHFLRFSTFIGPVCINWQGVGDQYRIDGKIDGRITGWHIKENGILQTAIVSTSSNEVCKEEFTSQWANAVTNDKFCVSNRCNKNVCHADNGGGFTVNRRNRHYLWGVAGKQPQMDVEFVIFTNIKPYQGIVMDRQFYNRPK